MTRREGSLTRHPAVVENRRIARIQYSTRYERDWALWLDWLGGLNGMNGLNVFKCVGKIDDLIW